MGYFFLSHIDLSGQELTLGVSDCHIGWAGEEGICSAVALDYTSDSDDLTQVQKLSGPHLELGDAIKDYLPI